MSSSSTSQGIKMPVLALDFDGVLCDSVDETAATGWRAGALIWDDMAPLERPPSALLAGYRQVRPVVETGYEAVLLMRLLYDGEAPETLLGTFAERAPAVMARAGRDVDALKALFGATRDRWLATAADEWLASSPLYPGIAAWMRSLPPTSAWYVVTTKERRFVARLLAYNGVPVAADRIFGLEYGKPKEAVLQELIARHPGHPVCFVEDRLATLKRCLADAKLAGVALRLAGWGYNTEVDRREAAVLKIPVWEPADLFRAFDQESHLDQ
jgi:phosphoglycolate phosphatase-like HAD superfamily hydrolase